LLIGLVALGLTFLAALSVGYRTEGSLLAVLVVGAVATLGVGVSAFLTTIFELLGDVAFELGAASRLTTSSAPGSSGAGTTGCAEAEACLDPGSRRGDGEGSGIRTSTFSRRAAVSRAARSSRSTRGIATP